MKKARLKSVCLAILIYAVFVFAGCGDGASGTADSQDSNGEVVVSLTDAPGDFANYTVDVMSLTLTRDNGAQVATLPMQTRIDFSQYTDMSEFLTAAKVPAGVYVAATMTLNYTNADIWVENEGGDPVRVDTIMDSDGQPVTTKTVTARLENRNRLVIAQGVPAHLMLDFNLEATNRVGFNNAGIPMVTVDPFIMADVNRGEFKLHRVRGLLKDVSQQDGSFSVYLRPFYCALTGGHSRFGLGAVETTDSTIFDIDGDQYIGGDGLAALEALPELTAVVAVGDLAFNPLRFEAREVYAGSSVPGGAMDVVEGSVVSRQGDTLTVKGATLIRQDGTIIFNDQVSVEVGADTMVSRQFSLDPFDKDDISIGQRVVFSGQLTDMNPLLLTMDATQGYARMKLTIVRGLVTGVDEGNSSAQLTMEVQSINHHRVSDFDFTGTGMSAAHDADPGSYEINTGTLEIGFVTAGDPVKVRGFVQPFGQAPGDFNAQTIVSVSDVRAFLKVQWRSSGQAGFESISSDGLMLNMDGAGPFHHLTRGWVVTDLADLGQSPMVEPYADGTGLFVIRRNGIVQVVQMFDDFIDALQGYMEDGAGVHKIGAAGEFDGTTATLTADMIEIDLD